MKLNIWEKLTLLAVTSVLMVGCSKPKKDGDMDMEVEVQDESTSTSGAGSYGTFTGGDLTPEEAESLRQQRVFYFEYDSSSIPHNDLRAI